MKRSQIAVEQRMYNLQPIDMIATWRPSLLWIIAALVDNQCGGSAQSSSQTTPQHPVNCGWLQWPLQEYRTQTNT